MAAKALLGSSFRRGWAAKLRNDGYDASVEADPTSPKARTAATMQHYVDHLESVPVVVLVCLERYRDANPYEGASVYPACQNLLLAARALGWGGALTMWHQMVEAELRELLAIPDQVALSACITLGRPAGRARSGATSADRRPRLRRRMGRGGAVGGRPRRHAPHPLASLNQPVPTGPDRPPVRQLDTRRLSVKMTN